MYAVSVVLLWRDAVEFTLLPFCVKPRSKLKKYSHVAILKTPAFSMFEI